MYPPRGGRGSQLCQQQTGMLNAEASGNIESDQQEYSPAAGSYAYCCWPWPALLLRAN